MRVLYQEVVLIVTLLEIPMLLLLTICEFPSMFSYGVLVLINFFNDHSKITHWCTIPLV